MAVFVSSGGQQTITVDGATNPAVSNVSLSTANTEVSIVLPAGCRKYMLKLRDRNVLQLSYVSGQSDTTYVTLWPGCVYVENEVKLTASTTIYVQSPAASQIVELVTWT